MDLVKSYEILELPYGSSLKSVRESWKLLSQLYHPDRYREGTKVYEQALKKQKAVNSARDVLVSWYKRNPDRVPPPPFSKPQSSSNQTSARKKNASNPKPSPNAKPQASKCKTCTEKKSRQRTQEAEKTEERPIEPPARCKSIKDKIFEIAEKNDSGDDINPAKVVIIGSLAIAPLITFANVCGSIFGKDVPQPFGLFVFLLGVAGSVFLIWTYRVERDIWQAEWKPESKYSDKTSTLVFGQLIRKLEIGDLSDSWKIVSKSSNESKKEHRLHIVAQPVVFRKLDQRIDLYVKVEKSWKNSETTVDVRVSAPGHRFKAQQLISDFHKSLDSIVTSS